jgi:hypothetical protein
MSKRKIPKHWRIHPNYLNRMEALLEPHQTETDFVETALHAEIVRQEEAARRESQRVVA